MRWVTGQQPADEPLRQTRQVPADDQQDGRVDGVQAAQHQRGLEGLEIDGHASSEANSRRNAFPAQSFRSKIALIGAALLLLVVLSAAAVVDGTRVLSVSPTSPAIAQDVGQLARRAGQDVPRVTARR